MHSLFSAFVEINYGRVKSLKGALNILFSLIVLGADIFLVFHLLIMIKVIKPI